MKHFITDDKLPEKAMKVVHCPWCGNISNVLKNTKGRFHGSEGSMLARYSCSICGKDFNLLLTGDNFFPERGFDVTEKDFNIRFV